jgi:hypothetical protein
MTTGDEYIRHTFTVLFDVPADLAADRGSHAGRIERSGQPDHRTDRSRHAPSGASAATRH